MRDTAATHGLSAHKLATIHEICGVRFGSLVSELFGISLNDFPEWQAEVYPDQTIQLQDYLWNPETTFQCPILLNSASVLGQSYRLSRLVTERAPVPLEIFRDTSRATRVFRIGDSAMQPLFHPGDLVLVDHATTVNPEELGAARHPVIVQTGGRFLLCWIEPVNGHRIRLAFASERHKSTEVDLDSVRIIGRVSAFCKDLRPKPPEQLFESEHTYFREETEGSTGPPRLSRMIRRYRESQGVGIRVLVKRLERLRGLLPLALESEIPSLSTLSAAEHKMVNSPKLSRLILISLAIQADLRRVLQAVGITIRDQGKVTVAERINRTRAKASIAFDSLFEHPIGALLTEKWQELPWLLPYLFREWDPASVCYIGKRSRFMHPLMAEHCFVVIDRKAAAIAEVGSHDALSKSTVEGWRPMYMLERRSDSQIMCAHCRREGNTIYLIPFNQFGGERISLDLHRDVLVLGEVIGVVSRMP